MGFAKLAKFADSAGTAVQDVEEEDQRSLADELAQPELASVGIRQGEVGERLGQNRIAA
jgi:hypothetical protein